MLKLAWKAVRKPGYFGLLTEPVARKDSKLDTRGGELLLLSVSALTFALIFMANLGAESCVVETSTTPSSNCNVEPFSVSRRVSRLHSNSSNEGGYTRVRVQGDTSAMNSMGLTDSCLAYLGVESLARADGVVLGNVELSGSCEVDYEDFGNGVCRYTRIVRGGEPISNPHSSAFVSSQLTMRLDGSVIDVSHWAHLGNDSYFHQLMEVDLRAVVSLLQGTTGRVNLGLCALSRPTVSSECPPVSNGKYNVTYWTNNPSVLAKYSFNYYSMLAMDVMCGKNSSGKARPLGLTFAYHPKPSDDKLLDPNNNMFTRESPGSPYVCNTCTERGVLEALGITLSIVWALYSITKFTIIKLYRSTRSSDGSTHNQKGELEGELVPISTRLARVTSGNESETVTSQTQFSGGKRSFSAAKESIRRRPLPNRADCKPSPNGATDKAIENTPVSGDSELKTRCALGDLRHGNRYERKNET
eukprot:1374628-Amorphochlora_amoeboformis.AAC.1